MTIAMANNSKTATAIVTPIIMIEDEVLCEMGDVVVAAAMSVLDIISVLETPIDNIYNNYF